MLTFGHDFAFLRAQETSVQHGRQCYLAVFFFCLDDPPLLRKRLHAAVVQQGNQGCTVLNGNCQAARFCDQVYIDSAGVARRAPKRCRGRAYSYGTDFAGFVLGACILSLFFTVH